MLSKHLEPGIANPDFYRKYLAKSNHLKLEEVSVPAGLLLTYHRGMFETMRRRIRGRYLKWYFDRRLAAGSCRGVPLAVLHSYIGSPMTGTMLEELIACGAKAVMEVGICGGLDPSLRAGEIIVADQGFSDEGTSRHYFRDVEKFATSTSLQDDLEQTLERLFVKFRVGGVWTTDAPYRETRSKLSRFRAHGALGVNMETSAVFAISQYRGIEAASVQVVSDLVGETEWKPKFHENRVAEMSRVAASAAVDSLATHLKSA